MSSGPADDLYQDTEHDGARQPDRRGAPTYVAAVGQLAGDLGDLDHVQVLPAQQAPQLLYSPVAAGSDSLTAAMNSRSPPAPAQVGWHHCHPVQQPQLKNKIISGCATGCAR
jgi:hypothetical protein